ncbi:MAG: LacI family DNA-binding transcriptional regulator [Oscillospiraceae bacterium]
MEAEEINKPVTLKDVAEKSNFSLRTVKKVFLGEGSVRPKTRDHILAVAKELNYTKNQMASILASNRQYHIAIVIGNFKYFFPEMKQGFIKCAESLRDYKVSIDFYVPKDKTMLSAQNLLAELADREDIDAVILHASSMTGLERPINNLIEKGKPVFTVGADAPYSKRIAFIGPKAYESGRIAAQVLANYVGKSGEVYVINQMVEQMQTAERTRGFLDAVEEKYPNINVHRIVVEEAEEYYNTVKELVKSNDVAGILCTDADCYMAGRALQDVDEKDVVVVGYDLTEEVEALMELGYIKIVLSQNPALQANVALRNMCEYLAVGSDVTKNIFTPVNIITSECLRYQKEE